MKGIRMELLGIGSFWIYAPGVIAGIFNKAAVHTK